MSRRRATLRSCQPPGKAAPKSSRESALCLQAALKSSCTSSTSTSTPAGLNPCRGRACGLGGGRGGGCSGAAPWRPSCARSPYSSGVGTCSTPAYLYKGTVVFLCFYAAGWQSDLLWGLWAHFLMPGNAWSPGEALRPGRGFMQTVDVAPSRPPKVARLFPQFQKPGKGRFSVLLVQICSTDHPIIRMT